MILVDSNVLVYAVNTASPKHSAAQDFLRTNGDSLVVAHQNIFEALRVLTRPKFPNPMTIIGARRAIDGATAQCTVIHPTDTAYQLALRFITENNLHSNKIFDAYLAATALANGVNIIASDNAKDFKAFKEITVHDIFDTIPRE